MAGTDSSKLRLPKTAAETMASGGPAVVLVGTSLAENIGTAARAMLNFGLTDLRLVAPKTPWPHAAALNASSGADAVVEAARVFDSTAEAVADLGYVVATTARLRDMVRPSLTPHDAAAELRAHFAGGEGCGILFGPERTGLKNDDIVLADALVTIPANPGFSSLNLAQTVIVLAYEWFQAGEHGIGIEGGRKGTKPASKAELLAFFEHLECELDTTGFLRVREKRPRMVRNIRNIFNRANLTDQEVRTLRGIVSSLRRTPR